ncbi:sensor histidine kinase [Amycolatopsis sp. cmx-4-61]|uniref:sensor histidine kinase n=1 Tax=Amycolatopsis sp. cmx-4-61 TaxID=2790937 RepID=UPI00397999A3
MSRLLVRVTLTAAAVAVVIVLAVFAMLDWSHAKLVADASAAQQAASVADFVAASTDADLIRAAVQRSRAGADGDVAVYLGGQRTVGGGHADPRDVASAAGRRQLVIANAGGGAVRLLPVAMPDGAVAVVETYQPTTDLLGPFGLRLAIMVAGAFVAVAAAAVVGYRRTRPLVESIRAIAAAAPAIGEGRTGIEIPPSDTAEVTELIGTLNQISGRVEQLMAAEREFVADLSHRLRTPLTALRLDSQSVGEGPVADRIRQSVRVLEHDVDNLIRTATRATRVTATTCDAAKVLAERMTFWSELAGHQGRRCEFEQGTGPALVSLPAKEFAAVVDSLLANVIQHTPPGTPIAVTVVRHAGWVTLAVEDGGPGIADVEAAMRRGASGRGSTGLGLDIARHAVEATGGTIHIDRGRLGGARIRLRFAETGTHHDEPAPKAWRLWSRPARLPRHSP